MQIYIFNAQKYTKNKKNIALLLRITKWLFLSIARIQFSTSVEVVLIDRIENLILRLKILTKQLILV